MDNDTHTKIAQQKDKLTHARKGAEEKGQHIYIHMRVRTQECARLQAYRFHWQTKVGALGAKSVDRSLVVHDHDILHHKRFDEKHLLWRGLMS